MGPQCPHTKCQYLVLLSDCRSRCLTATYTPQDPHYTSFPGWVGCQTTLLACSRWEVERYDPAVNAWEAVAPMEVSRRLIDVAVLDGKLYAVGGYNEGDQTLSSVERYDPAANAWEEVAPMAEGRDTHAVAVLDGKLYAVGGEDSASNPRSSVERYDPATNVWEPVVEMAMARSRPGVALL